MHLYKSKHKGSFSHSIAIYLTEQYISPGQGVLLLFTKEETMYRTSLKLFYVQILSHTRRSENIQRNQINIYIQTKVYVWKGRQMDNKDRGLVSL